jgi:hypothetical protein
VETLVTKRRFRMAPNQQFVMKTLAVGTFALLCAGCTKASANCRDEVAAAFERLRTSGRPYRKETTWVFSGRRTSHEMSEFVPPDRMRVAIDGGPSYLPSETIRVGQRAWTRGWPWGWREWDPGPRMIARMERIPAYDVPERWQILFGWRKEFTVTHVPLLQDPAPIPADDAFECLGKIEFDSLERGSWRWRRVRRTKQNIRC